MFRLFLAFSTMVLAADPAQGPRELESRLIPAIQLEGRAPVRYTLAERLRHYRVPAVSVAAIRGGKLAWAEAWGTLEAGGAQRANPETMFQAASISKPVAALAALHMAQNGNFGLDDDVNGILKSWKVPSFEFPGKVTVREILSHSAGLTVHGFRGYAQGEPVPTVVQVLDGAKPANSDAVKVDVAPGTIWRYSGGGYTVLQLMLADKSGMAFPDLMERMVLKRLGMSRSAYSQPLAADFAGNAARGHVASGSMIPGRWHTYPEMAAAGLWTTPTDLTKFLIEVWKASRGESNRVIEKAMAQEMLKIQKGSYGLGVGLESEGGVHSFGHGGSNEGFKCQMEMQIESGDGLVVMTNGDAGWALTNEIFRAASDLYGWTTHKAKTRKAVDLPQAKLKAYEGTYQVENGIEVKIVLEKGALQAYPPRGAPRVELAAESETQFFALEDGIPPVKFIAGASGKADQIEVFGRKAPRVNAK